MSNFNTAAFLGDARRVHLRVHLEVGDTLPDIDVRERIDEFIDYDKSLFSRALDDVCSNVVGRMMFTLLMTKKPPGQRLKITNIGHDLISSLTGQGGTRSIKA
jgi:hypothetical protein